jgi:ribosome maturation factor RimP
LVRKSDFERAHGQIVKIEMAVPVEGRKRFRGTIAEVMDDAVKIEGEGAEPDAILVMTDMTEAKLVLTDKLIAESFRRDKLKAGVTEELDDSADESSEDSARDRHGKKKYQHRKKDPFRRNGPTGPAASQEGD